MYGDAQTAGAVANDLANAGFNRSDVTVMANKSGSGLGSVTEASNRTLTNMGASQDQARMYLEGVNQGNILIAVKVSDQQASQAQSIMERNGIMDAGQGRQQRMSESGSTSDTRGTGRTGQSSTRAGKRDDETIEVVQEEIQVGKRAVETGGVRVNSYVHEIPVEEEVRLREEHVQVERRPVDRPANPGDLDSLRDKTIEVRETQEKPVVAKEARVVEEVRINKEVEERTETVRDTVRKTEVEVEQLGSQRSGNVSGYDGYDAGFRNHWQSNYANSGKTYERYQPAYRYGYTLANDARYRGRNWNEIESDVRRDWESQKQGPWENFKDSIRYSWDQVRGKA